MMLSPLGSHASVDTVLDVRDLNIAFRRDAEPVRVVQDLSFSVGRGETLALVGESGSGKSVTSLALLGLLPSAPHCRVSGHAYFTRADGTVADLLSIPDRSMRSIRGAQAAMVFQEPMTSLNPVQTVGAQIVEVLRFHSNMSRKAARERAGELLDLVGIPDPKRRLDEYPHQMSGGMRQRVMIAIAIACDPVLLIADEPTTALDVTIQAQILALFRRIQEQSNMAMIFITHNLGVVAEIADKVMVMYSGMLVEQASTHALFENPLMPYTRGLLRSVPDIQHVGKAGAIGLAAIPGTVPDPLSPPPGCRFAPRCAHRVPTSCDNSVPVLDRSLTDHAVRCVRWKEIDQRAGGAMA